MTNSTESLVGIATHVLVAVLNQNMSDNVSDPINATDSSTNIPIDADVDPYAIEKATYEGYLHREYFFYMLPCYYFLIAGAIRFYYVMKQPSEESLYQQVHNSYHIKRRFSLIMMILFILAFFCSEFMDPQNFWQAYFPKKGFLNLSGAVAWFISFKLLEIERQKDFPQHILTHRFYWISSFIIFLVKQFSFYELKTLNVIYNLMNLIITGALGFYGVYKPFDTDAIQRRDDFTMPEWARSFFEWFENFFIVRYFCKNYARTNELHDVPLIAKKSVEQRHIMKEMHDYIKRNKSVADDDHGKFMLAGLPRDVAVTISWRMSDMNRSDTTQFYFEVTTRIEEDRFTQEKKYSDFLALEKNLENIFNKRDYPELAPILPKFAKISIDSYRDERSFVEARIEILQKYLNDLFRTPDFICGLVLDFLGIEDPYRAPYETYFSYITATQKFKTRKPQYQPTDIEMPTISPNKALITPDDYPTNLGSSQKLTPQYSTPNKKGKAPQNEPSFHCYCENSQRSLYGNHYEYVFFICDKANPSQVAWRILKTYTNFKLLHQTMESETGRTIPYFNQYVPKPVSQNQTTDASFIAKRKEGLEKYLCALLQNKVFYTKALYEFIEYDIEKHRHVGGTETPRMSTIEDPLDYKFAGTQSTIIAKKGGDRPNDMTKSAVVLGANAGPLREKYYKRVYTGAHKRTINLNFCRVRTPGYKRVRKGEEEFFLYEMILENFDPKDKTSVQTVIIQYKRYRDFEDLRYYANKFYHAKNVETPELRTETSLFGTVDPDQAKANIEEFMNKMLALPAINEYNEMRDFLLIEGLRTDKNEIGPEGEIFDYRDDTIYDELVDESNAGLVKDLLKKADIFKLLPS